VWITPRTVLCCCYLARLLYLYVRQLLLIIKNTAPKLHAALSPIAERFWMLQFRCTCIRTLIIQSGQTRVEYKAKMHKCVDRFLKMDRVPLQTSRWALVACSYEEAWKWKHAWSMSAIWSSASVVSEPAWQWLCVPYLLASSLVLTNELSNL
jgi:hypothetical protein